MDPSCFKPTECRPRLLGVRDSSHVTLHGLHIVDAVFWTVHIIGSSHVTMTHCTVTGDRQIPNNDGVDIDGSSSVLVEDVRVNTGDDGVCVKASRGDRDVQDVLVRRCTLRSKSAAVKLGSEGVGNFRNITFEDILVRLSSPVRYAAGVGQTRRCVWQACAVYRATV